MRFVSVTFQIVFVLFFLIIQDVLAESLNEAVQMGVVKFKIVGMGASSGDSIQLTVSKTSKAGQESLIISLPPGMILDSKSSSEQDMVVSRLKGRMVDNVSYEPTNEINLFDDKEYTYIVEAYCTEFGKDNPSSDTQYGLTQHDLKLACILEKAHEEALSVEATQAAVWIITDNVEYERLIQKFPVSPKDWNAAKTLIETCTKAGNKKE